MSSTYRSAMGKPVDMAAIRSRNENVRAVGNMSVNARGDEIDSNNQVVTDSNRRVNQVYSKTTVNPSARVRNQVQPTKPTVVADEPIELSQAELELEQELEQEEVPVKPQTKSKK